MTTIPKVRHDYAWRAFIDEVASTPSNPALNDPSRLTLRCNAHCGMAMGPLPDDLEQAHRWIRNLQRGYHLELHYREQLEWQHSAFRRFVEVVAASPLLWTHGPLRWLRRAAKECLERDQQVGVLIQSSPAQQSTDQGGAI